MKVALRILILLLICSSHFQSAYATNSNEVPVGKIEFHGNRVYSDSKLRKIIITRPSSIFKKCILHEEVLKDDIRSLESFYQSNGYLNAKVILSKVELDTTEGHAKIHITIEEGKRTSVEAVSYFGNEVFDDSLLIDISKIQPGDWMVSKKLEDTRIAIVRWYADHGYVDAKVSAEIRTDDSTLTALIDLILIENDMYRIGEINITGLEKTEERVVIREIIFESEQTINYSRLLETQRKLYLTGLFKSVFLKQIASPSSERVKNILIEVQEKPSREYSITTGYGTVDGPRVGFEARNINFRGHAQKLGMKTRFSFIAQQVELTFSEPWTFGTRWQTDVSLFYGFQDQTGFNYSSYGGKLQVGRSFTPHLRGAVTLRHEIIDLYKVEISPVPLDETSDIRSIAFSLSYDTRDNLFNPRKGIYLEPSIELANAQSLFKLGYIRFSQTFSVYQQLNSSNIIASALHFGWIGGTKAIGDVPLSERLYAGGPNSVRGFKYERLGPQDANNVPIGGRLKLVINLIELRTSIYKSIGSSLFLDAGNVWLRREYFSLSDLRLTPGIGLRVNSPIGLGRLDYGFNIDPQKGEPSGMLYFSIGHAF
ncbi:outer membrane protein assembly factor BamA [Calditrichota bacterium]